MCLLKTKKDQCYYIILHGQEIATQHSTMPKLGALCSTLDKYSFTLMLLVSLATAIFEL
jgi:hypothetical protein